MTSRTLLVGVLLLTGGLSLGLRYGQRLAYPPAPIAKAPGVAPKNKVDLSSPEKKDFTPAGLPATMVKATQGLYVSMDNGPRFICTITMIQKTPTGYLGLTAKHCTGNEGPYYIQFDANSDTPFHKAVHVASGRNDVALFEISTTVDVPIIPIGVEDFNQIGDEVYNVGMPHNIGHLFFKGSIVELRGEHKGNDDLMLFELPAAGGSSGSAIVDPKQGAIIAVLTRIYIPNNGGVIVTEGVPAKDIREMLKAYNSGVTYEESPEHESLLERLFGPAPKR